MPERDLATWCELKVAARAFLGCEREAKGKGREGRGQLLARRFVCSKREERSEVRRRKCWWMEVEKERRGLVEVEDSIEDDMQV